MMQTTPSEPKKPKVLEVHEPAGSRSEDMKYRSAPRTADADDDLTSDQQDIFEEVGHVRDRDEMVRSGNRIVQGGSASDIDDSWSFERKDRLRGDMMHSSEAVDAQLKRVGQITEDLRDSESHRQPTVAVPSDDRREFDSMSDEQLHHLADSLGIPDRENLTRGWLILKIRDAVRH